MPCHPARARELLRKGKAAVFRMFPFTIILKERETGDVQPVRLKIDPGSKGTGVVLVNEVTKKVIFALVLTHRGQEISNKLDSRREIRRHRRSRKTRYRKPCVANNCEEERMAGAVAATPGAKHRDLG